MYDAYWHAGNSYSDEREDVTDRYKYTIYCAESINL